LLSALMNLFAPAAPVTPAAICMICSQDKSKNPVAMEPGCCGRWVHLDCLKLILSAGGTRCPSCSVEFPESLRQLGSQPLPQQQLHAYPVVEAFPFQQQQQQHPQFVPPPVPVDNNPPLRAIRTPNNIFGSRNSVSGVDARVLAKFPEDPIEPWNPVVISELKSSPDDSTTSSISTQCIAEVPELSLGSARGFSAVVSLAASANTGVNNEVRMETRPPMDIVCVLDISGSMGSDHKLENLKHAVDYIRGELSENDRMSIITFNSSAQLVHNLLRMNPNRKVETQRLTSQLRASGGTSILSGLQSAHQVLSGRQQANTITSVFLLTDGIDSSHLPEKQRTAQLLKEMGSSLFVFGFGNDHDSAHLQAIADAADGMFTFIERSDMVVDAFGGVLGAEQSIFATNIELHLRAVNGSQISQVESGVYRNVISADGSGAVIYYKNLMYGEERDILVVMNVSDTSTELPDGQVLLNTCVRYRPLTRPENEPLLETLGADCVVRRVTNVTPAPRNEIVDVQLNRLLLTRATKQSMDFADSGNYAQARSTLQDALNTLRNSSSVTSIKTQAFIVELELALNDVRSESDFRNSGGRANMSEKAQNYSRQRMCYAKAASPAMYQNISSCVQQERAKISKK
jgi:Mg-chelatase subunit ChlD